MKNEIKLLYKKNPKLAMQVAKALGYKIKSEKAQADTSITIEDLPADVKQTLDKTDDWKLSAIEDVLDIKSAVVVVRKAGYPAVTRKDLAILFKNTNFQSVGVLKNALGLLFKK